MKTTFCICFFTIMAFCQISAQIPQLKYFSRPFDAKVCYGCHIYEFSRNGKVSWQCDDVTFHSNTGTYKFYYDTISQRHYFKISWSDGKESDMCFAYKNDEKEYLEVSVNGNWYSEDTCR